MSHPEIVEIRRGGRLRPSASKGMEAVIFDARAWKFNEEARPISDMAETSHLRREAEASTNKA